MTKFFIDLPIREMSQHTTVRRQGFWNGRLLDSAESLAHLLFNIRRLDWRIANVVD